ncbi:MAG: hypothetical protein CFE21_09950 [Bacteroidetes bacterium B1(2017)]|nr:MAG: hypothetical protein CFE21_09950 [Bacteroidetes bacterium B1(2017)]
MDKNYYHEYFELERTHWWFLARTKILETQIVQLLKDTPNASILNIGAATGASSEMLSKFGKVTSIEYEAECIAFVKDKISFTIEEGTILDLNYPENSFDLVCAFDVVEHVAEDELALKEMHRVCKINGHVILTVPTFMSLWSKHDEVNHHVKRYQLNELKALVQPTLEPVFLSYFNTWLFLPIYLVRQFSNALPNMVKRSGSGSDFGLVKSQFINTFFYKLFVSENWFLRKRISLPIGVSALAIWKKKA